MKFLLVVKQKRNVDAFLETMGCLVGRGHSVTLAIQDSDEKRDERLSAALEKAGVAIARIPSARIDQWSDVAALLRRLRDCIHYLRPPMRPATKLRARMLQRLRQDLQFDADTESLARQLQSIPPEQIQRLEAVLGLAEHALPSDALFDEFLTSQQPDVLLLSPLIHFGSAQADLVTSARRLRIPVWMLLYSWDNLSTKGRIHRFPDRIFVWNEQQRSEAQALHGFPPGRVSVVGAPRFDSFFALRPAMTRAEFHEPLGLDPAKPTVLYVCSSRFVSEGELGFISRWLRALRGSGVAALRECNVVVRPHPDIPLLPSPEHSVRLQADAEGPAKAGRYAERSVRLQADPQGPGKAGPYAQERMTKHRWPTAPDLSARTARPFADDAAVVLQTDFTTPQGLYESIAHSTAVVGLNTTAELEAGIVGRPVFTILADDRDVDGQSSTLHFHYLTKAHGGFVSSAATFEEHVGQLEEVLPAPVDPAPIRGFIESFLRPLGIDKPVAPLFAAALESATVRLKADTTFGIREAEATSESEVWLPALAGRTAQRGVLPLGEDGLQVYATSISERLAKDGRVPLDPEIVAWLEQEVSVGDVVYDIGAGIGEYVVLAAKRRGATVVAFEPGFGAYHELCENVLLNGCEATVVPIPLAIAGRDGLAELKYEHGRPGETGYLVRDDIDWRVKHRGRNKPYLQPAVLARLDTVVQQYRLPPPNHIRISPQMSAEAVMQGARATVALPSLKTLFVNGRTDILVRRT